MYNNYRIAEDAVGGGPLLLVLIVLGLIVCVDVCHRMGVACAASASAVCDQIVYISQAIATCLWPPPRRPYRRLKGAVSPTHIGGGPLSVLPTRADGSGDGPFAFANDYYAASREPSRPPARPWSVRRQEMVPQSSAYPLALPACAPGGPGNSAGRQAARLGRGRDRRLAFAFVSGDTSVSGTVMRVVRESTCESSELVRSLR